MNRPEINPPPNGSMPDEDRLAWYRERLKTLQSLEDTPEVLQCRQFTEQRIRVLESILNLTAKKPRR